MCGSYPVHATSNWTVDLSPVDTEKVTFLFLVLQLFTLPGMLLSLCAHLGSLIQTFLLEHQGLAFASGRLAWKNRLNIKA